MTPSELYRELDYVNHSREKRAYYAKLIIEKPELLELVLEILFLVDDPLSNRAGWLAEFVIKEDITILFPHLTYFTNNMTTVYQDSALRPIAKICENLTISYYKKQDPLTRKHLTKKHRSKIVEAGFDWMITDQKVAVKAYTMTTLYYLGTEFKWVHPELQRIMEEGYEDGSAAFKARSRYVGEWIKKISHYK